MPSWLEGFRQETYPNVRNKIHQMILGASGKGFEDVKDELHTGGNYTLTKKLGKVLSPQSAAAIADAAYGLNETLTGAAAVGTGRPFFSRYGYSTEDLFRNKKGQELAKKELLAEQAKDAERRFSIRGFSMPYGK